MTRLKYYTILELNNSIELEPCIIEDTKEVLEKCFNIREEYVLESNCNADVCKQLINILIEFSSYWMKSPDIQPAMFNIRLLTLVMEILGSKKPVIPPSYDEIKNMGRTEMYIKSIAPAMVDVYVQDVINSLDNGLRRLEVGNYYTHDIPFDIRNMPPNGYNVHDLFYDHQGQFETDYDKVNYAMACFSTALRSQTIPQGIKINRFRKLIKFHKRLIGPDNEFIMEALVVYLDKLAKSIIKVAERSLLKHAKPNNYLLVREVPHYFITYSHTPDLTDTLDYDGLLINVTGNRLTLTVTNDYNDYRTTICEARLYDFNYPTGDMVETYNLYGYEEHTLGGKIIKILEELGMKDLFYQEPKEI